MTDLKRHTYVTCTLYKRKERSGAVARTLSTPCERVREIGMLLCLVSLFRGRFVPAFAFWGREEELSDGAGDSRVRWTLELSDVAGKSRVGWTSGSGCALAFPPTFFALFLFPGVLSL